MYEGIRSPAIHIPKNMSEFNSIALRYPKAKIWAGGTYLMSQKNYYPSETNEDIIDLGDMEELKKITRNDRFVEIGSMVTASQLLSAGKLVLPDILLETLQSLSSQIVRRQITIGGTLCIPDKRLSLSTTLAVLDATAEIKLFQGNKVSTQWIPISRLYDKNGKLVVNADKILMTRIRIGLDFGDYQRFYIVEDPIRNMEECVIFAFQAKSTQSSLNKVKFCMNFPQKAFHINKDIEAKLSGQTLPINPERVNTISYELVAELKKQHSSITELQLERGRRMFESVLHGMNSQALLT
ncbi:aerobic-type carbon monoxide dehydrogenase, middle subunit CoxM/CutM-like protein [Sphaerochaeta pleomorpha str. Grapes]|uniref:Aerobic-type carbon monoxide dehydrogenase, middle subunit CoxM/CutM-like protein n=1 Tax=Sphaerochaeta pleomorpha (strain ATCC BAA-1885 / DSM 22778 / Grapes) TaxID=158190 RepID=G8QR06_SPHPG|nr:FAD binding domain-containing protein [Sphaerochaeta pleomorpha]AEV29854.1 aerobic-type carbon monoxide dehydrogenase, middle subunit CoxM/CutM-like protein [Sphaerochaeta pleomorpha str. Grapes]